MCVNYGIFTYSFLRLKMTKNEKTKKTINEKLGRIQSIPDGLFFDCVADAEKYYKIKKLRMYYNGRVHTRTGQTFIREIGLEESIRKRISEASKRKRPNRSKTTTPENVKKQISETMNQYLGKIKSIPDNIVFDNPLQVFEYYGIRAVRKYYNGNIHKKTGQTFIRVKTA